MIIQDEMSSENISSCQNVTGSGGRICRMWHHAVW